MTEHRTVYFKNASGEVHPVELVGLDATQAVWRCPWEWSHTPTGHKEPPEGFQFSAGNGGGSWPVRGTSHRVD
jgi:hypothetical protein